MFLDTGPNLSQALGAAVPVLLGDQSLAAQPSQPQRKLIAVLQHVSDVAINGDPVELYCHGMCPFRLLWIYSVASSLSPESADDQENRHTIGSCAGSCDPFPVERDVSRDAGTGSAQAGGALADHPARPCCRGSLSKTVVKSEL